MADVMSSISSRLFSKLEEQGISSKTLLGWGMNLGFGAMTYHDEREKGRGIAGSAASAIGTNIMMDIVGAPAYIGIQAAQALPKAVMGGALEVGKYARSLAMNGRNKPFINAHFNDSQQAYTMRQAGMSLAKASKYNLQQTMLGNEASYMHY